MNQKRCLYIHPGRSTFVAKDIDLLSKSGTVQEHYYDGSGGGSQVLVALFKELLFLIVHIWKAKVVFVMFGGYHSFFPALFGRLLFKKVYIILGGTDCVSFPSIAYGTFRKKTQGKVTCLSYRIATRLLPVHRSLIQRSNSYYGQDSAEQGCYHWCKGLKTPHTEIVNGYDPVFWNIESDNKPDNTFLTIAALSDQSKVVLKGVDLIVEVASRHPHCSFIIIGDMGKFQFEELPNNVELLPFLSSEELLVKMASARFYLQLSISEGFPNALSESMLSKCIPIVSNVAAMPEIVGDTGYILESRSVDELNGLILKALSDTNKVHRAEKARQRIVENYPISRRENDLLKLVTE